MQCITCKYPHSHVVKTWYDDDEYKTTVIRRRECMLCKKKFVTHEVLGDVPDEIAFAVTR
jgi:transcriptional regulator NrdR family protein